MKRIRIFRILAILTAVFCSSVLHADVQQHADEILKQAGISGGFIVHVGAGDGSLAKALQKSEAYQVHGLVRDVDALALARDNIRKDRDYGEVCLDQLVGKQLPYVDNLVNVLVTEDLGEVPMEEVMRVLVPNGVALIKKGGAWEKTTKPRPDNIDDWSHYLHDASGNSVAHDDVVAPPRHLQWVGSPRWSRHHDRMASMSALVSTNGRMFYILDEGSRISIQMPSKWKLISRDAFNGTILWKRDIANWQSHLWPLKSGPTQLARRLVATDDTVYTTLGFAEPMVAIDAATGETKRTFEGSGATEEIITTNGMIFIVARKGEAELADYAPLFGRVGDQAASESSFGMRSPAWLWLTMRNQGSNFGRRRLVVRHSHLALMPITSFSTMGNGSLVLIKRPGMSPGTPNLLLVAINSRSTSAHAW